MQKSIQVYRTSSWPVAVAAATGLFSINGMVNIINAVGGRSNVEFKKGFEGTLKTGGYV